MKSTDYQELIYKRTYSRWLVDQQRREEWIETVDRYQQFFLSRVPKEQRFDFDIAICYVRDKYIMPSMRALWTAGTALERDNIAGYNCCYLVVDTPKVFAEMLYILMNGTGVGFSIERQIVTKLPEVPSIQSSSETIVFADSKRGWAEGFYRLLQALYKGELPKWDLSKIRPKGSLLKTFGGRASGPEPLEELLNFTVRLFMNAIGRKLNSLECHDLCCKIASVVVVGGVRRSACISLSNLSDDRLAKAKSGEFWFQDPQRALANNSTAYTEKPDTRKFLSEWIKLLESRTGERGIFNRQGANYQAAKTGRRETGHDWGCNPCGEIILRPKEFCNLTEIIVGSDDSLEGLRKKVKYATILGCVQSTLTSFNFLSRDYRKNCEQERLLGVSLTGLRDHPVLNRVSPESKRWVMDMKETAIDTAKEWAGYLGINVPAAITCVKPSGTVSQLVNCSSGLHPRYAEYYIRRVRISAFDPLAKMLSDQGYPWQPEVGESRENYRTMVFEFPQKAPSSAVLNDDVSAIDQLEYWKFIKEYWCEHNPSCTIFVKEHEWVEVGAWVYANWQFICGVSFLPADTGVYRLAPYEEITEDQYTTVLSSLPDINWGQLSEYETSDQTEGSREFACIGNSCEV